MIKDLRFPISIYDYLEMINHETETSENTFSK